MDALVRSDAFFEVGVPLVGSKEREGGAGRTVQAAAARPRPGADSEAERVCCRFLSVDMVQDFAMCAKSVFLTALIIAVVGWDGGNTLVCGAVEQGQVCVDSPSDCSDYLLNPPISGATVRDRFCKPVNSMAPYVTIFLFMACANVAMFVFVLVLRHFRAAWACFVDSPCPLATVLVLAFATVFAAAVKLQALFTLALQPGEVVFDCGDARVSDGGAGLLPRTCSAKLLQGSAVTFGSVCDGAPGDEVCDVSVHCDSGCGRRVSSEILTVAPSYLLTSAYMLYLCRVLWKSALPVEVDDGGAPEPATTPATTPAAAAAVDDDADDDDVELATVPRPPPRPHPRRRPVPRAHIQTSSVGMAFLWLRDLSALAKYLLTASSLVILAAQNWVQCDPITADFGDGIPRVIPGDMVQGACVATAADTGSLIFRLAFSSFVTGCVFLVLIVIVWWARSVHRRHLRQAKSRSARSPATLVATLISVVLAAAVAYQFAVILSAEFEDVSFQCRAVSANGTAQQAVEQAQCAGRTGTVSPATLGLPAAGRHSVSIDCSSLCSSHVPFSVWSGEAALALSVLYMAGLVWQYWRTRVPRKRA